MSLKLIISLFFDISIRYSLSSNAIFSGTHFFTYLFCRVVRNVLEISRSIIHLKISVVENSKAYKIWWKFNKLMKIWRNSTKKIWAIGQYFRMLWFGQSLNNSQHIFPYLLKIHHWNLKKRPSAGSHLDLGLCPGASIKFRVKKCTFIKVKWANGEKNWFKPCKIYFFFCEYEINVTRIFQRRMIISLNLFGSVWIFKSEVIGAIIKNLMLGWCLFVMLC